MREGVSYPSGVIHSVCWGHNTVWDGESDGVAAGIRLEHDEVNLGGLMERNRREELEDFEDIVKRLKGAWRGRTDIWLLIAASKCDLYWDRLDEARDYYIPRGDRDDSPFARLLMELVGAVGMGNFRQVSVLPFSSRLDTYRFGNDLSVNPGIDATKSSNLASGFRETVGRVV